MEKLNRQMHRSILLAFIGALVIGFPCNLPAQTPGEKILLAKAQSLASHGRLDMAVQTWQQVLLANPKNTEALAGIAKADMQLGKTDEAGQYLDRLRAAGGSAAGIAQIEAMPHVAPQAERLKEARSLSQSGQYAQALRIYRDVLGNEPQAGNYALEYYDMEAAMPENRPHAIEGLRRLSKQFPADSRYAIALGRILTYDPKTRSEGIALLQQYKTPDAENALKRAAEWNTQAQGVVASTPARTGPRTPAGNPLEASAYRALNAGRLDEAEQQFRQVLEKQPNNARALSGMGYVFMKHQDFTQAADYFKRAGNAGAKGLGSSLATAHFWEQMARGNQALKNENNDEAVEAYRAAVSMKPSDPDALEALAGALMQQGNPAEAIEVFGRLVRVAPTRRTVWRGLFLAQSGASDPEAALAVNDRIPANIRAQLNQDPSYLRALLQDNLALGRQAEANRIIQQALTLPFPNHGRELPFDQQMQYAALLMAAQRYEPACRSINRWLQATLQTSMRGDLWSPRSTSVTTMRKLSRTLDECRRQSTTVCSRTRDSSC